jgi:hypothetical protein
MNRDRQVRIGRPDKLPTCDPIVDLLSRVATAYDRCEHRPNDADVIKAYQAFKQTVLQQFDALKALGFTFNFGHTDPYDASAPMFADLDGGRLNVYTVATLEHGHPMQELAPGACIKGCNGDLALITYNSVFRAVHDTLAHYLGGRNTFAALGELKAFRAHCKALRFTPDALPAVATETLGQNSWMHFGPPTVGIEWKERPFAPQKATLLPSDLVAEALSINC